MVSSPHILILPFPAQGHVTPLMELSHRLVDHGIKITFVNTDFNHDRLIHASLSEVHHPLIRLVSVPDGMGPGEDRNDLARLCESMVLEMPSKVEQLIQKTNETSEEADDKITWMIADENMAFAFQVAKKMGIKTAGFWPAASALLALMFSIPNLIEQGVLSDAGLPIKQGTIKLHPDMPDMDTSQFAWNLSSEPEFQRIIYRFIMNNFQEIKLAEFIITNSFQELELATFAYMPSLSPVGPLTADEHFKKPVGHFWAEDEACMNWLDEQPDNSVIYVAFGSITILNQHQFHELALGLDLSGRPFLWVVRPDLTNVTCDRYPTGFLDRVATRGRIVDWSPQQKVLAHPSIACFLTHCGWNSTIEGVRNGVPFLCWPYFCDQFLNQSYICDVWKIGLRLTPDDDAIVSSGQIKLKSEELLSDDDFRTRSLIWKEKASDSVREGGSSYMNMNKFISAIKER